MAAVPQAESARRFYEGRAPGYDHSWHPSYARRFSENLDIAPGEQILDLACGTGLLTFLEAERVGPTGRVVGVDVTLGMLNQAKAKKNDQGDKYSNVELYEGDILRLDTIEALQNRVFDKITVACALVLLPDPHTAIMHWKRYLKPGGIIALDSTHPRNLISGIVLERTGKRLGLPIPYFRDWSTSEHALNEVLEGAGLEVEKVITIQDQAGYGRRYQDVSEWDDHFTQQILVGDIATVFANPEIRRKAQAVYKDEWEKLAVNEFVEEVDAVFFGIARKPERIDAEPTFTGGCRCGNVRYRCYESPTDVTFCYCRACQQLSGSGYLPFVDVSTAALEFTAATSLSPLKLSDAAERSFCTSCGSPISMVYTSERDKTGLVMGSIHPKSLKLELKPRKHIFLKEKAPWVTVPDDGLPRFEGSSDANLRVEAYSKPK